MKKTKTDWLKYTHFPAIPVKDANRFNNGQRLRPLEKLEEVYHEVPISNEKYLVHWFRSDLRAHDNTALFHLVENAKAIKARPIGVYIICLKLWKDHLEGPFKVQFILDSLNQLRKDLSAFNIPLAVFCEENFNVEWFENLIQNTLQSNTVFFNIQYEYDELTRDIDILSSTSINFHIYHDQCIIKPGSLVTGKGSQYSKFAPWYKKWKSIPLPEMLVIDHKFEEMPQVVSDDYSLPLEFVLDEKRFYKAPMDALEEWISKENIYKCREYPGQASSSRLSPYITVGALSPRYVVSKTQQEQFIREVAFRDFYRHAIVNWPFLMMHLPFNFSALDIEWSSDVTLFQKWCFGQTGFPFVDASMRQLLQTGYMNNRCRMICASFLCRDLAQDWRMGEKWFHHHLVDADLSSNNGGWGWCSSTGIDAQPWFRMFNVYTQSLKFDRDGEFIKRWVPELSHVSPEKLHGPLDVDGYPPPIVNRERARERSLHIYRSAFA